MESTRDTLNAKVLYILAKDVPCEPKFYPGRYGHKYDSYTCGRCGAGISEAYWKYCPNCGQRINDAYLGRRKTKEEQRKYHQINVFDLLSEMQEGGNP